MPLCSRCNTEKQESDFPAGGPHAECRACKESRSIRRKEDRKRKKDLVLPHHQYCSTCAQMRSKTSFASGGSKCSTCRLRYVRKKSVSHPDHPERQSSQGGQITTVKEAANTTAMAAETAESCNGAVVRNGAMPHLFEELRQGLQESNLTSVLHTETALDIDQLHQDANELEARSDVSELEAINDSHIDAVDWSELTTAANSIDNEQPAAPPLEFNDAPPGTEPVSEEEPPQPVPTEMNSEAPGPQHPLSVSYTPEGTEPTSDDVTSASDDVTRMLGQQLRLEASGQLIQTGESRPIHGNFTTTDGQEGLSSMMRNLQLQEEALRTSDGAAEEVYNCLE